MRFLIIICIFCLGLNACSGDWTKYPQQENASAKAVLSVIKIGDTVRIDIYGNKDISGHYDVDALGDVHIPLVGSIDLAGQTTKQANETVTVALEKGGYLVNPNVSVALVGEQTVMIMGEVMAPGEIKYKDGLTILDVVAKAQGFSYRANQASFDIVRKIPGQVDEVLSGDIATRVQPGDVIRVRERYF